MKPEEKLIEKRRECAVELVKAAGQEVINRAEDIVGKCDGVTDMELLIIKFVNGERLVINLNDVENIYPARGNAKKILCKDGKIITVMMDKVMYTCAQKGEDVSDIDDGTDAWN